jgi:hypothetical protein
MAGKKRPRALLLCQSRSAFWQQKRNLSPDLQGQRSNDPTWFSRQYAWNIERL